MSAIVRTKSTPILLASKSGSLDAVTCLLELGADVKYRDSENRGIIHMALISTRTHIIEYFINLRLESLLVWEIILGETSFWEILQRQTAQKCSVMLMRNTCNKRWIVWRSWPNIPPNIGEVFWNQVFIGAIPAIPITIYHWHRTDIGIGGIIEEAIPNHSF